ncbi:DoxX family protein [Aestuariimicrobium ganziense]|uniref:DoxX family protein n=1 Tax=Aestuariimicrobium ganziense TaxID=2773677 RepID=UPI001945544A|nr:DoxX family protein [Aestuariimicrobium ganziense]
MTSFVRVLQDIGLMLARIATGTILMLHGWRRWQDGIPHQVTVLNGHGVPYPEIFGWGTVIFELLGGALLVFGLATPVIGLVLLVQQVMLMVYSTWRHGFYLTGGGYEYNLALASLGTLFMVLGSGRAGVDSLFRRSEHDPERRVIRDADPA